MRLPMHLLRRLLQLRQPLCQCRMWTRVFRWSWHRLLPPPPPPCALRSCVHLLVSPFLPCLPRVWVRCLACAHEERILWCVARISNEFFLFCTNLNRQLSAVPILLATVNGLPSFPSFSSFFFILFTPSPSLYATYMHTYLYRVLLLILFIFFIFLAFFYPSPLPQF